MGFGIVGIIVAILIALVLFKIIRFGLKVLFLTILAIAVSVTIWICVAQPDIHDPFSINTIEYLFKINKDGSMTTTKQITETMLKESK